ncbi:gonadotropin-releasing hormone 3 [Osmerus eperlanus]|uniref:gonadotropin-releasing hormone 3 n=1 Tax=Osmerus eperlanus TaxID=29151 RepID=UPI002E128F46
MDLSSRTVVNLVVLALVAQVTVSQHWSYGWLPGGKRSVGELEATIRMMGTGGVMSAPEETSLNALERLNPYDVLNDESNHFKTKKHQPNK